MTDKLLLQLGRLEEAAKAVLRAGRHGTDRDRAVSLGDLAVVLNTPEKRPEGWLSPDEAGVLRVRLSIAEARVRELEDRIERARKCCNCPALDGAGEDDNG